MQDRASHIPFIQRLMSHSPLTGSAARRVLFALLSAFLLAATGLSVVPIMLVRHAGAAEPRLQAPTTVFVDDDFNIDTPGFGVDHFDSIQDGIDAVASGGNVNVAAGTFAEAIAITKFVTVTGALTDTVLVPQTNTCFDTSSETGVTMVSVEAASVTVDGLYIDGEIGASCSGSLVPRAAHGPAAGPRHQLKSGIKGSSMPAWLTSGLACISVRQSDQSRTI